MDSIKPCDNCSAPHENSSYFYNWSSHLFVDCCETCSKDISTNDQYFNVDHIVIK